MTKATTPKLEIEHAEEGTFLVLDDLRIAKRGAPGTPEEETWMYLEPGYDGFEGEGFSAVVIDQFEPPLDDPQ